MRKIYMIFIFLIGLLILTLTHSYANHSELAEEYEISIIEKLIIDSISKRNPYVYIYSEDKEKKEKFKNKLKKFSKSLKTTSSLYKADFIIVLVLSKKKDFKKPALALDFKSLKYCLSCIGVFSWKNGRPNLILFKEKLDMLRIKLPQEYSYFIEE